jgi:AcrR family transcriptional regulator
MSEKKPGKRRYKSTARQSAARATRHSILTSARELFARQGYAATSMPAIAKAAGVALDTVYASIGAKATLFRLLVESAISGEDQPVPSEQRDYVLAIRAEADAEAKLKRYAAALSNIQPRLAPLLQILRAAAETDAGLKGLWREISDRRAQNMRLFAKDLQATGRLRQGLSIEMAADILWSMNSPEYYLLLVGERRWTAAQFETWLAQSWVRLLLD